MFMTAVSESLTTAIAAREEADALKSSVLWREIFGEEFPLYEKEEATKSSALAPRPALGDSRHAQPMSWRENLNPKKRKVHIDAYLYKGDDSYGGLNSDGLIRAYAMSCVKPMQALY